MWLSDIIVQYVKVIYIYTKDAEDSDEIFSSTDVNGNQISK